MDSVFDLLDQEFRNAAAVTNVPKSNGSVETTKDSKNGDNLKADNENSDVAVSKKDKKDVMPEDENQSLIDGEQISPKKNKKKRKNA